MVTLVTEVGIAVHFDVVEKRAAAAAAAGIVIVIAGEVAEQALNMLEWEDTAAAT